MRSTEFPEWAAGLLKAVGAAAVLGAGSTIITTRSQVATQEVTIADLKSREESATVTLRKLDDSVRALDKNVAVLNERLKHRE